MTVQAADPVTLLAIDDDPASLELISESLAGKELRILTAADPGIGLELLHQQRPQIVLLDMILPNVNGLELLDQITSFDPTIDVVLITGHYSTESAVEAIRKGASDYLNKPVSIALLRERIGKLVSEARRRSLAARLGVELRRASEFEGMVGQSPLMQEVFVWIRRAAPHFRTALVCGATGTGKELVAHALHRLSPVAANRFVVCNASAIVETLFESELFGHVRGAFTGATQDKLGLFEYANGGTLFLDEIGDMPLSTQAKLLRVLQHQELQRVGSLQVKKIDVRVIAATNRHLPALIADNHFREDLYYRLSMFEVALPRLAERKEDLPLLIRHFVEKFALRYGKKIGGLTPRAHAVLARYSWPGNVRELENVLGSACGLTQGEQIDAADLPERLRSRPANGTGEFGEELASLADMEYRYVMHVLQKAGGNKTRAAEILGINRATLHRLIGRSALASEPGESER
jgi:DNA-binding NtrC family response regulator